MALKNVYYEIVQYQGPDDTSPPNNELNIPITVFSTNYDALEIKKKLESATVVEIDDIAIKSEGEDSDNDILVNFDDDDDDYDIENKVIFNEESISDDNESKYDAKEYTTDGEEDELKKEYATLVPLTDNEARAVHEILQQHTRSEFVCETCSKRFKTKKILQHHSRLHNIHISGIFECDICYNRYKSDFLLQVHITTHHKYKYLCTKCPKISFDGVIAKQHYLLMHHKKSKSEDRPKWLRKLPKSPSQTCKANRKTTRPSDYPIRRPVDQLAQYQMVLDRQLTKKYETSPYKCECCFKSYRDLRAFQAHMKKHDPSISGSHQCDMCKQYFRSPRKVYDHLILSHLFVHECRYCSYRCFSRGQALAHYNSHKNVKYPCPVCELQFRKPTTLMTHIRIKHPTTAVCNLCGHSFVSENGLTFHKKVKHTREEVEQASELTRGALGIDMDIFSGQAKEVGYCSTCDMQFANEAAFLTHLESSSNHVQTNLAIKPVRWRQESPEPTSKSDPITTRRRRNHTEIVNNGMRSTIICDLCGLELKTFMAAKKHYAKVHPGAEFIQKRFMCDICGHTTQIYSNLQAHMRKHTQEKPFGCPHCDRRFTRQNNRDRHLLVHTGEKKYQCATCLRRFTQKVTLKLHIQTVHMKIPYAPWNKNNRKRKKDMDMARV